VKPLRKYKGVSYRIRDIGPNKSYDRYTLITEKREVYGFSSNPYHAQGFGQYCGEFKGNDTRYLGKLIDISDLPEEAQKFVRERI